MSAEAYRDEEIHGETGPDLISIKRNPYLVDYEQQRKLREHRTSQSQMRQGGQRIQRTSRRIQDSEWGRESERAPRTEQMIRQGQEAGRMPRTERTVRQSREAGRAPRTEQMIRQEQDIRHKRAAMEKKRAAVQRRRIARMQRLVLFAGVFCIALLCGILYMKHLDGKAEVPDRKESQATVTDGILPAASSSGLTQGLPAAEFAKHPEWEENFLTPNEYSRPGDALEEVNSIFVHYTANPNTSAAQNRSYFEQLKDTHITSASAHFIIGYNGEIVQCIPLDEIAYAVQTRNFDSVSIECCYKAADGSFTQETYDSLIELLAWLTKSYDLSTDDILRHYDCGGKKCPVYYTEHEDAWERLKKDVGEKL